MKRRHLTFRQLELFEAVARHGSLTRAAQSMHLTQPAVSIQMRKLSEAIGHPLFESAARELQVTDVGRELLSACRDIEDAWSRFEAAVGAFRGLERGRLRVSTVTTAKYFLPRMLGQFCRRHPGIDVELEVLNRDRIVARVSEGLDDLYVMGVPPEELDVVAHPFLENELVVIAPVDHPATARRRLRLGDLARERFILRESGSGTRRLIDAHLAKLGIRLDAKLSLGSNEAIREAVAGGMGLAILSRHALAADPQQFGVKILNVSGFPLRGHWYVVHPRRRRLSIAAQAFLDELLNAATGATASRPR